MKVLIRDSVRWQFTIQSSVPFALATIPLFMWMNTHKAHRHLKLKERVSSMALTILSLRTLGKDRK